jgi:hypothetical protein
MKEQQQQNIEIEVTINSYFDNVKLESTSSLARLDDLRIESIKTTACEPAFRKAAPHGWTVYTHSTTATYTAIAINSRNKLIPSPTIDVGSQERLNDLKKILKR